jgi:hypothetical protein
MSDRQIKIPGPDHPIEIQSNRRASGHRRRQGHRRYGGGADAKRGGLRGRAVYPRRDVDMTALARSDHTTYCPYKGEASYFSIPIGGERSTNAVWTYETPFPAMAAIKDYVAFYPDRVDEIR